MNSSIKYTAREFDSIRESVVNFIRQNYSKYWTDYSESNAGMIMVDVIAYAVSILSWNLDKQINETYLSSAEFKDSVLKIAEMFGYKPLGRTSATCVVDASITSPLEGIFPIELKRKTALKTIDGVPFEIYKDAYINPGEQTPTFFIENSVNTVPSGMKVNFTAGSIYVPFYTNENTRHSYDVHVGMYIRSTEGFDKSWYRIKQINADYSLLTLDRPWNFEFNYPFIIKTQDNDGISSEVVIASAPYGDFASDAIAHVGSKEVTFLSKLPSSVMSGQYWRFNTSICGKNKFFLIEEVSADRMSIILAEAYGPDEKGGFDCEDSEFEIQNRGLTLIQGETRTEEFLSSGSPNLLISLSSENIVSGSIKVYDESGVMDFDGNPKPWIELESLALATEANYRGYEVILNENDNYDIQFGNGIQGKIPVGKITVEYLVGGGVIGNVPAGSFNTQVTAYQGSRSYSVKIVNPESPASGGSDGESVADIKLNIPKFHSTNMRAVTGDDYINLILNDFPKWSESVGSVAKANLNLIYNQSYYGGNCIYINCWENEGWINEKGRNGIFPDEYEYNTYSRIVPIRDVIRKSAQSFIDMYKLITDTPYIVQGKVNYAVIDLSVQLQDTADNQKLGSVLEKIEESIVALFNKSSVLDGDPLLISDVYGAVESIDGVIQARLRKMYLNYGDEEPLYNDYESETPESLQGVHDLYPRSTNEVVTPSLIKIKPWSQNQGLTIYINSKLYVDDQLAKESIRQALEKFFYSLEPGYGVTINQIRELLLNTTSGTVNRLPDCKVASTSHIDISNRSEYTTLTIDGVPIQKGDVILLKDQDQSIPPYSENGLYYVVDGADGFNPWVLRRIPEANSFANLTPGSITKILQGVDNVGKEFYYKPDEKVTSDNFPNIAKIFVEGNDEAASASIAAIVEPNNLSVKFDYPVGNTDTEKPAVYMQMYYLKDLKINEA